MGGFLGIGGSSAKTDRADQLQTDQNLFNIFNYSLPQAQAGEAAGTANLGTASNYFQKLLTAGRTQTAQNAAPAVNAALAGGDAQRRAEASGGTGRTGGTTDANRTAATGTQSNIDSILNSTLQTQKKEGAQGLAQVGGTELGNATSLLGTGAVGPEESVLSSTIASRPISMQANTQAAQGYGTALGAVLQALMAGGGGGDADAG